jgi:hypothetical protein
MHLSLLLSAVAGLAAVCLFVGLLLVLGSLGRRVETLEAAVGDLVDRADTVAGLESLVENIRRHEDEHDARYRAAEKERQTA